MLDHSIDQRDSILIMKEIERDKMPSNASDNSQGPDKAPDPKCEFCHGNGHYEDYDSEIIRTECDVCEGTGLFSEYLDCGRCRGRGFRERESEFLVEKECKCRKPSSK